MGKLLEILGKNIGMYNNMKKQVSDLYYNVDAIHEF